MGLRTLLLLCLALCQIAAQAAPRVAIYYGTPVPRERLQAFDWAVVDPDALPAPYPAASTEWFAYVAVGEVTPSRAYFPAIPKHWLKGRNAGWGSLVIDQTAPGWPDFFLDRIVEPLWRAGYRGFFLDTLDSWQLIVRDEHDARRQQAALINIIYRLKQRYPEARLIFNRGFEILPALHPLVAAVAAESLFEGWNSSLKRYEPVSASDRLWLLRDLYRVKYSYGKPIIAIDYVPPAQHAKQIQTAHRIQSLGFIPWVSVPDLDIIGVGAPPRLGGIPDPTLR